MSGLYVKQGVVNKKKKHKEAVVAAYATDAED